MVKGYKLTSASGDGPKTCAFFFSDKGCRNGANCKFSHEKPAPSHCPVAPVVSGPPSVSSSSVVSSESESEGEIVEDRAGAYASLTRSEGKDRRPNDVSSNPFLAAVGVPPAPPPASAVSNHVVKKEEVVSAHAVKQEEGQEPNAEKKRKKKRKKKQHPEPAADENIFDLEKAEAGQSPIKQENNGTAAAPHNSAAAVAAPPNKKAKKAKVASPQNDQKQRPTNVNSAPPSFRNLQLPIASFSIPSTAAVAATKCPSVKRSTSPQHDPAPAPPPLPLPTATAAHLKWKDAVIATQKHTNYPNAFNYERAQQAELNLGISAPSDWIASRPYGAWCASNPASIAIDCEMCETRDPVSGRVNNKALCRISVVNAENPDEVLLDTLVKPQWPVSDHRTWINGISKSSLEDVQFTLKHAQTFMQALCSDQTVVVGHAVHNDLLVLRMVHHCNADTAMLFTSANDDDGTPSLKNLALGVLKREMPDVHDSVNDARVALACAKHYVERKGKVDPVEKVYSRSSSRVRTTAADTSMLLVHRLPTSTLPQHISEMFLAYTCVKPCKVPEMQFSGSHGRCNVVFTTPDHAELAYRSLVGEEREDKNGKKQKRVGLKGGGYVCVRKMTKK